MIITLIPILLLVPSVASILLGGSGCCCTCGIPMPSFCGCQPGPVCPPPLPCPLPACPVCTLCALPAPCPLPQIPICPAPAPIRLQSPCVCGGGEGPSYFSSHAGGPVPPPSGGYPVGSSIYALQQPPLPYGPQQSPLSYAPQQPPLSYAPQQPPLTYAPQQPPPPYGAQQQSYGGPVQVAVQEQVPAGPQGPPPPSPTSQYEPSIIPAPGYSQQTESNYNSVENAAPVEVNDIQTPINEGTKARASITITNSKCSNNELMELISKNIVENDPVESKRAIHRAALEEMKDSIVDVICSDAGFTYIVSTSEYCEAQQRKVICFVYKKT